MKKYELLFLISLSVIFFIILFTNNKKVFALESLNKKVLLIIYDPILSNGQKLHQARNWQDPIQLATQVVSVLQNSSNNFLNYQTEISQRNEWPPLVDGYRYNETDYNTCLNSGFTNCHIPVEVSYARIWQDLNLCNRISSGEVDEVFLYGPAQAGWDEFAVKIPADKMPYDTPTNYWLYQGRKKDIPDCNGKTVFVMGFIYERGLAEALESYGHRTETALSLTVGRGHWGDETHQKPACYGTSDWDKFSCVAKDISTTSLVKIAGCGNVHFPPNGTSDYDYANQTTQTNNCAGWINYPEPNQNQTSENCDAWGCNNNPHLQYLTWWYSHIPRQPGVTANGNLRNWWKYIADFDNAIKEVKLIPGDLNYDGKVDILDLHQLFSNFTDIFDYNLVVGNFGRIR